MLNLLFSIFIICLMTLTNLSASLAGLTTGNFQPSSYDSKDRVTSIENEISGIVTGNFYEFEYQAIAEGVVTGNFRTTSSKSPYMAAIAEGVVTGNFQTICGDNKEIATDTWYVSSDGSFNWLITNDTENNVKFFVDNLDDKKTFVISIDIE